MQSDFYNDKRRAMMIELLKSKDKRITSALFLRIQRLDRKFDRPALPVRKP